MRQALSVLQALLLAALVAFPLASGGSGAPPDAATIGIAESFGLPAARPAGPAVRSLSALKGRTAHDGLGHPPALAPAAWSPTTALHLRLLDLDPPRRPAPVTGSARRLPAFPTGPPSHD